MADLGGTFNAALFETQRMPDALPATPQSDGLSGEQRECLGMYSGYLGQHMHTPEQVLRHYVFLNEERAAKAAAETAEQAKSKRYDPVLRAQAKVERDAHATVVNAANLAWREAVARRAKAMAEFDIEVKALHSEYTRLKNLKPGA